MNPKLRERPGLWFVLPLIALKSFVPSHFIVDIHTDTLTIPCQHLPAQS